MNDEIKRFFRKFKIYIEKKNLGFWFFLFIAVIIPFIIEYINCATLRYYRAYYATVLTLSFAIYSFIQQQKKALEEKKKELELREKELEAEKDYYRPMFVVESMDNSKKQVKLLMKSNDLYLEKTSVYAFNQTFIYKVRNQQFKSGDIISQDVGSTFFITGETLKGELILFGYLLDGIKIYKYLKSDYSYALSMKKYERNSLDFYNRFWGTYNTNTTDEYRIKKNQLLHLDTVLFQSTYLLRKGLSYQEKLYFYNVLITDDTFSLVGELIAELYERNEVQPYNDDSVYEMIKLSLKILCENKEYIYIHPHMFSNFKIELDKHLSKDLTSKVALFEKEVNQYNNFDISKFSHILLEYLEIVKNKSNQYCPYFQITRILDDTLYNMECKNPVNKNLLVYKDKILRLISAMNID